MFYALGSNGAGQLGLGHTEDVSTPELVSVEGNAAPWRAQQLAAGGNHTVILCDDGHVRVTGTNEDGRAGLQDIKQVTHFTEIPLPIDMKSGKPIVVRSIAATWAATMLLSTAGEVYVCGSGEGGELGLGKDVARAEYIERVSGIGADGAKVTCLASGMAHTVVLLSNGEVYGWGKARRGQLGRTADAFWTPQRIEGVTFVPTQVTCGKDFTIVVGEPSAGELAVLGGHMDDKFGIQAEAPSSASSWKSIATSWGSGYILSKADDVVAWGRNDHGQLPTSDLSKVQALAAGSEHCLALLESGQVAAWGWGEHGNCGLPLDDQGDAKPRPNFLEVAGRVTHVFAGCSTSFIQTEDG